MPARRFSRRFFISKGTLVAAAVLLAIDEGNIHLRSRLRIGSKEPAQTIVGAKYCVVRTDHVTTPFIHRGRVWEGWQPWAEQYPLQWPLLISLSVDWVKGTRASFCVLRVCVILLPPSLTLNLPLDTFRDFNTTLERILVN